MEPLDYFEDEHLEDWEKKGLIKIEIGYHVFYLNFWIGTLIAAVINPFSIIAAIIYLFLKILNTICN